MYDILYIRQSNAHNDFWLTKNGGKWLISLTDITLNVLPQVLQLLQIQYLRISQCPSPVGVRQVMEA